MVDFLLMESIKAGKLHPREFAHIYAYEKNKISTLYKKSIKKNTQLVEYKFNFPFGKRHTDIKSVNNDRQ